MNSFDLRLPLGWLFLILGILLELAGFRPTPSSDGVRESFNINLIWGIVMIAFGLVCLWLVRRNKRKLAPAGQTPRKAV
jgi:hypothetical protein